MAQKLDRNSLVGFLLIGVILLGYTYWVAPTQEEQARFKAKQDSLAQIQQKQAEEAAKLTVESTDQESEQEVVLSDNDSIRAIQESQIQSGLKNKYGRFSPAGEGNARYLTLENEKIKFTVSTEGGRPISAEVKDYKRYDGEALYLFDEDSSSFNLDFKSENRLISTSDLFFVSGSKDQVVSGEGEGKVVLKALTEDASKYIEFVYSLKGGSNDVQFTVNYVGLDDLVRDNNNQIDFRWQMRTPAHEKGFQTENIRTSLFYKEKGEKRDYISERSAERVMLDEELEADLEWIVYKQQFFSVGLIANDPFVRQGGSLETVQMVEGASSYIKDMIVDVKLPVNGGSNSSSFSIFLGPNQHDLLAEHNLSSVLDYGWGIFGWVGEYFILQLFLLLSKLDISYGIIILLLTFMIKLILSPLTYKSYLSGAKMKVLKPEITEINEKFKDADPMKKQQETMALYRKAGVNPMAGCVPMLLQMPILYAMFMFFPTSIELRGESFLWASDLATYDSILELPFSIPFYGAHVSLFTLLMAGSMFFYTKSNMASGTMGGGGNEMQAQQMKIMLYFMPVMMLFFFNSYPAGLSYYYLCANLTSIGQNWAFRRFLVDEKAIHEQVQERKKQPQKKSKFQKRMEDLAKQKGIDLPK